MIKTRISFVALGALLAACASNPKIPARSSLLHVEPDIADRAEMTPDGSLTFTDDAFDSGTSPVVEITEPEPDLAKPEATNVVSAPAAPGGLGALDCSYYKIGNPYLIDGVPYYPHEDWTYSEVGMASWYGADFHGNPTANGESFDKGKFTAAHRTLPMPSLVRVTNLENNMSVTVKVNDRGPFARDRIIDLSAASAQAVGLVEGGIARVKVEILAPESQNLKRLALKCEPTDVYGPEPSNPEMLAGRSRTELSGTVSNEETIVTDSTQIVGTPLSGRSFFVQVAAFSTFEKAETLKNRIVRHGDVKIFRSMQSGSPIFKVRLGEYMTEAEAVEARTSLENAGIKGSRVLLNDNGVLRWR